MSNKTKKVELVNTNAKVGKLVLTLDHAERLLKMPRNGGWELPKNSPYNLTENGLVKSSNSGNTKKPEKQGGNK